ncbi:TPA: hypothetical protein ACG354_002410 [Escherichia coli]
MEQHTTILQALANGSFGNFINESSDMDINIFEELLSAGMVTAIDASTLDGKEYLDPKITLNGRQYLSQLSVEQPNPSVLKGRLKAWGSIVVAIAGVIGVIYTVASYYK